MASDGKTRPERLLERLVDASRGRLRLVEDGAYLRLEAGLELGFDMGGLEFPESLYGHSEPRLTWVPVAKSWSLSDPGRRAEILDRFMNNVGVIPGLGIQDVVEFEASSPEELDLKLTAAGY